jgi:hypothetical protein
MDAKPRGGFLDTFPIGAPFTFIGCGYKGQDYFAPLLTFDHDLLTTRKSGHSNFMPPFVSAPRKAVGFEGTKLIPKASEVEIAAAMNRLLTEPQFKEAARRVGDAIKADIDRSSFVDEMETIAAGRWASQQPLRRQLQGTA